MDEENELRDAATKDLVHHLRDSGAAQITLPAIVEDESYEVVVRRKLEEAG